MMKLLLAMGGLSPEGLLRSEMGPTFVGLTVALLHQPGTPAEVSEPRALKLMKKSCCLYTLDRDGQNQCPICLEQLAQGQLAWTLPCMHQVHHTCALRCYGVRGVRALCPLCRWSL